MEPFSIMLALCDGNPLVTGRCILWCYPEQAVDKTMEWPVILDAKKLRSCNITAKPQLHAVGNIQWIVHLARNHCLTSDKAMVCGMEERDPLFLTAGWIVFSSKWFRQLASQQDTDAYIGNSQSNRNPFQNTDRIWIIGVPIIWIRRS